AVRTGVAQTTGRRWAVLPVVCVAGALILLLRLGTRVLRGRLYRTAAAGASAGICFCLTAVFLVLTGDDVARHGLPAALWHRPLLGLCASSALGMVLVQDAFATGALSAALTAMAISDPVASWLAGTVLFDAEPRPGLATLSGSVLAVGLIAAGVVALANSPTL